ncbi:MAG: hypothetical protein VB021_09995 [Oscillospiraceae bacterium]|nr:hypothetical protein [Oscillospiraceae bacterium]
MADKFDENKTPYYPYLQNNGEPPLYAAPEAGQQEKEDAPYAPAAYGYPDNPYAAPAYAPGQGYPAYPAQPSAYGPYVPYTPAEPYTPPAVPYAPYAPYAPAQETRQTPVYPGQAPYAPVPDYAQPAPAYAPQQPYEAPASYPAYAPYEPYAPQPYVPAYPTYPQPYAPYGAYPETEPASQPVAPAAQPVAPMTQPVAPVTQPVAPVTQPVAPATQPVAPTEQPAYELPDFLKNYEFGSFSSPAYTPQENSFTAAYEKQHRDAEPKQAASFDINKVFGQYLNIKEPAAETAQTAEAAPSFGAQTAETAQPADVRPQAAEAAPSFGPQAAEAAQTADVRPQTAEAASSFGPQTAETAQTADVRPQTAEAVPSFGPQTAVATPAAEAAQTAGPVFEMKQPAAQPVPAQDAADDTFARFDSLAQSVPAASVPPQPAQGAVTFEPQPAGTPDAAQAPAEAIETVAATQTLPQDTAEVFQVAEEMSRSVLSNSYSKVFTDNNLAEEHEGVCLRTGRMTSELYLLKQGGTPYHMYEKASLALHDGSCAALISDVPLAAYVLAKEIGGLCDAGDEDVELSETPDGDFRDALYIGGDEMLPPDTASIDYLLMTQQHVPLEDDEDPEERLGVLLSQLGLGDIEYENTQDLTYNKRIFLLLVSAALNPYIGCVILNDPQFRIGRGEETIARRVFAKLAGEGKGVLLASCGNALMAAVANRVIALRGGRIVFDDTYKSFLDTYCLGIMSFTSTSPDATVEFFVKKYPDISALSNGNLVYLLRKHEGDVDLDALLKDAIANGADHRSIVLDEKSFEIACKEVLRGI